MAVAKHRDHRGVLRPRSPETRDSQPSLRQGRSLGSDVSWARVTGQYLRGWPLFSL